MLKFSVRRDVRGRSKVVGRPPLSPLIPLCPSPSCVCVCVCVSVCLRVSPQNDGQTPLHLASAYGHVAVVQYLVETAIMKDMESYKVTALVARKLYIYLTGVAEDLGNGAVA